MHKRLKRMLRQLLEVMAGIPCSPFTIPGTANPRGLPARCRICRRSSIILRMIQLSSGKLIGRQAQASPALSARGGASTIKMIRTSARCWRMRARWRVEHTTTLPLAFTLSATHQTWAIATIWLPPCATSTHTTATIPTSFTGRANPSSSSGTPSATAAQSHNGPIFAARPIPTTR